MRGLILITIGTITQAVRLLELNSMRENTREDDPINIHINNMNNSNPLLDLWFDTTILNCLRLYYWPFFAITQIDTPSELCKISICKK